MNEIISAFANYNILSPGTITLDGHIHRFKARADDQKKSGWYLGFLNHSQGGETFEVVTFGDYGSGQQEPYKYVKDVKLNKFDKAKLKEQMEKSRKAFEAEQRILHEQTAREVSEKWEAASDTGNNEYLEAKGIHPSSDLGVKYDGNKLLVPVRDKDGKLWSLQEITFDSFLRRKFKAFVKGGRVADGYHTIGKIGSDRIIITEGFATAATIYRATGKAVVIGFNAKNLPGIARIIRAKHPDSEILICGDEDLFKKNDDGTPKENSGRIAAEEAARVVDGKAVFPKFRDVSTEPTDFNDLQLLEGIAEVTRQLSGIEKSKVKVSALGFKNGEYFFTTCDNKQIIGITAFSEKDFLHLMPIQHWENRYPTVQGKADWTSARSDLMEACRRQGIFDDHNIRGAGVWVDEGRIVVNMGNHLIVDGVKCDLRDIRSEYFYTLGKKLPELHNKPLTAKECLPITNACRNFKWNRPDSWVLLAGAMVTTRVCGALPIRPHVWITGGANTGKTTLLEKMIKPVLGKSKIYATKGTTEAAVRQSLNHDAIPVLFDEFETDGRQSDEKVLGCIELMRSSWAESSAMIFKGGASGNATSYHVRFAAIVSSIRANLTNDADKSRFAMLELAPHGSDTAHWELLKADLLKIDEEFSERLFARTIKLMPVLLENFKVLKIALAEKSNSRFGDQYGMLLAGFSILCYDGVITKKQAEYVVSQCDFSEETELTRDADHDDALRHLLTTKITYESLYGKKDVLIGDLIHESLKSLDKNIEPGEHEKKALNNLGIKVDSDFVSIVSGNHAELQRVVWKSEKWSKIWGSSLARLDGASKGQPVWVAGATHRCVRIPAKHFNAI